MSARRYARSGSPYETSIGFSRGVRDGDVIAISGTAPVWPDGHVDPDPYEQAKRCWAIMLAALAELGGGPEHVIRTRQYLTHPADADEVGRAHAEVFGHLDAGPASTMVVVAGLLDPRWKVELELDAVVRD
jgi:enamine deaminase RidA (YjgF/YER057c/UK114 family)